MKPLFLLGFLISCTNSTQQKQGDDRLSLRPEAQIQSNERVTLEQHPSSEARHTKDLQFKKELYAQAPTAAKHLIPLLSAHHVDDLPDQDALQKHERAEEGLLWIAQSDYSIGLRSRAIHLLHLYPSPESISTLVSIAQSETDHALLRAAALNAIAKWSLERRTEQLAVISRGLEAEHPVVVLAAINASASIPAVEDTISLLQQEHPSPLVRGTAQK